MFVGTGLLKYWQVSRSLQSWQLWGSVGPMQPVAVAFLLVLGWNVAAALAESMAAVL